MSGYTSSAIKMFKFFRHWMPDILCRTQLIASDQTPFSSAGSVKSIVGTTMSLAIRNRNRSVFRESYWVDEYFLIIFLTFKPKDSVGLWKKMCVHERHTLRQATDEIINCAYWPVSTSITYYQRSSTITAHLEFSTLINPDSKKYCNHYSYSFETHSLFPAIIKLVQPLFTIQNRLLWCENQPADRKNTRNSL